MKVQKFRAFGFNTPMPYLAHLHNPNSCTLRRCEVRNGARLRFLGCGLMLAACVLRLHAASLGLVSHATSCESCICFLMNGAGARLRTTSHGSGTRSFANMYLQLRGKTSRLSVFYRHSSPTSSIHATNPSKPHISNQPLFAPPSATAGRQRFRMPGHIPS